VHDDLRPVSLGFEEFPACVRGVVIDEWMRDDVARGNKPDTTRKIKMLWCQQGRVDGGIDIVGLIPSLVKGDS
jgi:hypothetical protein